MDKTAHKLITHAIAQGVWRNPGSDALRVLLGDNLDLPELELFDEIATMNLVATQLENAGYVDDPEFCMRRRTALASESHDPRLVYEDALFIAGSIVPGDDVFVAVDLHESSEALIIRLLDWRRDVPNRWIVVGNLLDFVERLAELSPTVDAL